MSHVLIAFGVIILVFFISSFGVYADVDFSNAQAKSSFITGKIEHEVAYVRDLENDIGGVPSVANLGTASTTIFGADSSNDVTFSYQIVASVGYVCAQVSGANTYWTAALASAASQHVGWSLGGACATALSPSSSTYVLTAPI